MVKEVERAEISREGFGRVLLLWVLGWLAWKVALLGWCSWLCGLGELCFGVLRVGWYGVRGVFRLRE